VTEWASRDVVGETVTITEPKGSFELPGDAEWLLLVGDLTALPAMARTAETVSLPTRIWAEGPEVVDGYLPADADVTWTIAPGDGESDLAAVVEGIDWPAGTGYFWMAGESSQMRAIRSSLMRRQRLALDGDRLTHHVMGYWRGAPARQQQMQAAQ